MMTATRKSGRQPKPSARLKEYLYENEVEKAKETTLRTVEKKTSPVVKGPVSKEAPKKKEVQQTKPTGPRMVEKKSVTTPIKKEILDDVTPSRKSRRTPKPTAKLQEYLCDDKEKIQYSYAKSFTGVETITSKKTPKDSEKTKKVIKIKEEIEDEEETEESEEEEATLSSDKPAKDAKFSTQKTTKKPIKKFPKENVQAKRFTGKMTTQELLRKQMQTSRNITSRARVTSLTSIAAKKEKNASRLTIRKGKIYTTSPNSATKDKQLNAKPVLQEKTQARKALTVPKEKISLNKRKREAENLPTGNKKFIKTKDPSKLIERAKRSGNEMKINLRENACKVEKKEIEKVLQVNKEVMTQLLNFGAEVAEAMACNNESIFSFSTKDNPLQTFKIDKQQDDFSDEEVVKIIKWFEEEEEQRRAYRKRILEALRASHETNMSLYTQMLKMLQSVTTC
ncbi:transcriptional regulator ATRX homolog isoform X2 [Palaemon carinicauda]|uniref:transcriptional regulator ATRX homolog isoform X2 n=1 Tax=Palaemon carinicauda TaxID=392227 RepID=UPI0035B6255F